MRYNFTKVKALGLYKKYAPPKRGRGYFQIYHYIKNSEFCQELCLFRSELVEVDLWEVGADVGGVAREFFLQGVQLAQTGNLSADNQQRHAEAENCQHATGNEHPLRYLRILAELPGGDVDECCRKNDQGYRAPETESGTSLDGFNLFHYNVRYLAV